MALVGLIQLTSINNPEENLSMAERYICQAARGGAELVALPENFYFMGSEKELTSRAEPLDGPVIQRFQGLAQQHNVWILLGGFPERSDDAAHVFNASVLVDNHGSIAAVYRKIHLFDVEISGGVTLRESNTVRPGNAVVTVATPVGIAGLTICYDLRFPELFRTLTRLGAEVIFVPAAFTLYTGKDHWRVLLQARAIENSVYIVAPAQFGIHSERRQSYGRSLVVDPWGQILVEMPDGTGVVLCELDLDRLNRIRRELPSLKHQRLDLF